MRNKKVFLVMLVALLCMSIFAFAACKDKNTGNGGDGDSIVVSFESSSYSLVIGEETTLNVTVSEQKEGAALAFSSSDDSVASVDSASGTVTANAPGTATITATYGGGSATCSVTVGFGEYVPMIQLPYVDGDTVNIGTKDFVNLSATVSFNGKTYTNAEISYSVADGSVGAVTDGKFTPSKAGVTDVTVSGKWHGYEGSTMSKTVTVNVSPVVEFSINGGTESEIVIYTGATYGDEEGYELLTPDTTSMTPAISVKEDGEALDFNVELTSGSDIVDFNASTTTVAGKGIVGEATLTVHYTSKYDGSQGSKNITVYVKPSLYKYGTPVDYFSVMDGNVKVGKKLFAILDEEIVNAADSDGNVYEVSSGMLIHGIQVGGNKPTQLELTISGATKGVVVDVTAYTKVIEDTDDLAEIFTQTEPPYYDEHGFDGYYILANNINAKGYTHKIWNVTQDVKNKYPIEDYPNVNAAFGTAGVADVANNGLKAGLRGTFDGNGYTIDGMTMNEYGLFGWVNGGTVKNVALTNVSLPQGYSRVAWSLINAVIENVYIEVTSVTYSGTVWSDTYKSELTNVLIKYPELSRTGSYGSLGTLYTQRSTPANQSAYTNVYVVSPTILINAGTSYTVDAPNKTDVTNPQYTFTGVKRYNDKAEMKSDKDSNDYSSFTDSGFWEVSEDGELTWIYKEDEIGDVEEGPKVDFKYTEMFSVLDGDFDAETLKTIFGTENAVTLSSAMQYEFNETAGVWQATKPLDISEAGKIKNIEPNLIIDGGKITDVGYVYVQLTDNDSVTKTVRIKAYTKVIKNTSDLQKIFAYGATNPQDAGVSGFDGYYILANDINASAYTHTVTNNAYNFVSPGAAKIVTDGYTAGLRGTFDGNGYTIDGMTIGGSGLFGWVNGGTVKNVAFTNVKFSVNASMVIASYVVNAVIENVYMEIAQLTYSTVAGSLGSAGSVWSDTYKSEITNVLVKYPQVVDNTDGAKSSYGSLGTVSVQRATPANRSTHTNVYVVSPVVLIKVTTSYTVDAENKVDTATNTKFKLDGVKRYDDADAMKSDKDSNNYDGFTASGFWNVSADGMLSWVGKEDESSAA